ncbi:AAA family ATPase [Clostridium perfringens]|uniref:Putative ATPase n=1 Tax=Clostridium perfringens TaxID=1502 RepID=A0A140GR53_CLOPF|nr:AAA family ATPase [Clostridium perfringens]AMN31012.1 putative ATPase [Clostridium perfringens]
MGKIITVLSTTHGVGAKYITTNMSNYHKQMDDDKKILMIDFDFECPYLAGTLNLNDDIHCIDNFIEFIDGEILTDEIFLANIVHLKNNVDLIKGTKLVGHKKVFKTNHIETILEFAKKHYDFIYVVVSPDSSNAGAVVTLFNTDNVLIVSKNNYPSLMNLENVIGLVRNFAPKYIKLNFLYNQFYEESKIDFSDIIGMNDLNVIGAIPYNESTIDNMDIKDGESSLKKILDRWKKNNPQKDLYTDIINKVLSE